MTVSLYPHQEEAVEKLANGRILWGGVGVGKSITAVAYYMRREAPRNVFVITTAKKRDSLDWEGEFAKYGIGKTESSSVAGVLTVDSWNNIGRYEGVRDAFFIFDEQRIVGSGMWSQKFIGIARKNRWILLSATPGDTWLDYIPVFVANGFYRNRTEFKRDHVIYNTFTKFPKVDRYVGVAKLVRLRNELLVEMPYVRHTVRKCKDVEVAYDKELFERVVKDRWDVYENCPLRDAAALFRVMRRVVNSDLRRLEAVAGLLQRHKRLIVFYNFDYELDLLRTLSNSCDNSKRTKYKSGESPSSKMSSDSKSETGSIGLRTSPSFDEERWQTQRPVCIESSDPSFEKEQKKSISSASAATKTWEPPLSGVNMNTTNNTMFGSTSLQVAEWNGHKHQPIPETDSWVYLVQYVAGAEGWNCVETDAVCFYSLTYSYKNWHQAHGRIDRLNSPFTELYYYYLKSSALIDQWVWKALKDKKNFNERRIIQQLGTRV